MLIVDAHLDLSMNALQGNRDLTQSVYTIRSQEAGVPGKGKGQGTVAYPEMRQGRIALSIQAPDDILEAVRPRMDAFAREILANAVTLGAAPSPGARVDENRIESAEVVLGLTLLEGE